MKTKSLTVPNCVHFFRKDEVIATHAGTLYLSLWSVKASYDLSSLAHFIHDEQLGYHLNEVNDIAGSVSSIQLTYSTLYICYLELIVEGKLKENDIPKRHNDLFMFIGNHLTFLNKLEQALLNVKEVQLASSEK